MARLKTQSQAPHRARRTRNAPGTKNRAPAAYLRLVPAVHRAAHQLAVYITDRQGLDVTQAEAHILAHLTESGPVTIAALHRAFAHRRSTLTSILDRMVDRDLVSRTTGIADRRTFVVALTTRGRTRAREVVRTLRALEARAIRQIEPADLAGFERVMAAIERGTREDT